RLVLFRFLERVRQSENQQCEDGEMQPGRNRQGISRKPMLLWFFVLHRDLCGSEWWRHNVPAGTRSAYRFRRWMTTVRPFWRRVGRPRPAAPGQDRRRV